MLQVPGGPVVREELSRAQARRIALAAQGFAEPRPAGRVDARHIRRVLDRVALLQIDSVNVLSRSHYLPVFSRLGPYPREILDRLSWGGARREMFEYWAHVASLVPLELHPLLRWRMRRAAEHAWPGIVRIQETRPAFVEEVLALVAEQGPIGAGVIERDRPRASTAMWDWHDGKVALEWLFYTGQVTTAGRPNFERQYDLTERVLPAAVLAAPTPTDEEAQRELMRRAGRAHGVATEFELRDYFRLRPVEAKARLAELVEAGDLTPVRIEGSTVPHYLSPHARLPRWVRARALLSPFDSLVWERTRTERLFGFRYRIEIYVPAPKRVYGYYVLPFLLGDELVGRVDLKADRAAGVLIAQAAYAEPGRSPGEIAEAMAAELELMAGWLGLSGVTVVDRGDLAPHLAAALKTRPPKPR